MEEDCNTVAYIKTTTSFCYVPSKAYKAGGHFHIYSLLLICSSRLDKSESSLSAPSCLVYLSPHRRRRRRRRTLEVSRNNSVLYEGGPRHSQFTQVVVIHPSRRASWEQQQERRGRWWRWRWRREAQITSRTNAGWNVRRIEMRALAVWTSHRRILNSERNVCLGRE